MFQGTYSQIEFKAFSLKEFTSYVIFAFCKVQPVHAGC